jgi:DNA-binding NtrC family response regulator/tetratricopeptide (TPR) repeat protein
MKRPMGGTGDPFPRGGGWTLGRADLAVGGGRLTTLWHPLLPEFTAALPSSGDLVLLPKPAPLRPLERPDSERAVAAILARLAALASFLKFHGLGVAFEDVSRIGLWPGSGHRPALGAAPVPEWRAVPPALLVSATAIRLGGGSPAGADAEALRRAVERALERGGLTEWAAAAAVDALQAQATGTSPEGLVPDLARRAREGPALGGDLLGICYPLAEADETGAEKAAVRFAEGEGALFVARGAARRTPSGFIEVGAADRLEEGSALRRLGRLLGEDPRAEAVVALAAGHRVARWPAGPPIAVVALGGDAWDERSRKALEGELARAGFRLFETRAGPPRPWEPRAPLRPRLSRGDVASLLWLPFRSWAEAAAAWDGVAEATRQEPGRFLRLARSLAAAFDPAGQRPSSHVRFRTISARKEPLLSAAAILGAGFTPAELAQATGAREEEASETVRRAGDAGLFARDGAIGWRFAREGERRRYASQLSARARRSIVERLERGGLSGERAVVAALARGDEGDLRGARELFEVAVRRGDRPLALDLLARASAKDPDLGRSDLAVRLLSESGRLAEARAAAARLGRSGPFGGSLRERSALARLLARLGEAEAALAMTAPDGSRGVLLARAEVLLDLKRTEEASRLLEGLPLPVGEIPSEERLRGARLAAEVASRRGDLPAARGFLEGAAREISACEPEEAREFLMTSGFVAIDEGRFAEARAFFRRARDLSADARRRADASLDAATASFHAGDFRESEEELERALALYAEAGDEERYLSALGNRIDLAFRAGRYDLAREALEPVLRFESSQGREHQYLFAAASRQHLARLEGDDETWAAAFRDAEARRAAVPDHPAWREILILEAARLLSTRRPSEALRLLEKAGELPDNREQTEPLRCRVLASALGDLGRDAGEAASGLSRTERALLRAEAELRAGHLLRPDLVSRMESGLTDARGAADTVARILEWRGRFPEFFSRPAAAGLLELGRRAAARAGLGSAGKRIAVALEALLASAASVPQPPHSPPPFVAEDAATQKVLEEVGKVARTKLPVLILGETGTGKELFAREVHRLSGRPGAFVPVNVAALSGSLIESELFGHVRGAFTGADRDRRGLVEESSGGTLFLDEIGDLATPLQAKLLRVLQEGEVRRVGDTRTRTVDIRVVSATHRDLKAMVDNGSFRRDLLYRLSGLEVALPPLRRRPRDLMRLVAAALGTATLTSEARSAVIAYPWPGNVRELLSGLEAARALAAPSPLVDLEHLPPALRHFAAARAPSPGSYRREVADARTRAITRALEESGGNRTRAARSLGLSRQSLLYEMKVLGLKP